MNYSKGISWIDDCRIPFVDENDPSAERYRYSSKGSESWGGTFGIFDGKNQKEQQGRFPANLLCSDDVLNDGTISNGKVGMTQQSSINKIYGQYNSKGDTKINDGLSDQGTNSRYYDIDKWFDYLLDKLQKDTDGTIH